MTVEEWKKKNPPIRRKPQTNYDRIVSKTPEELAVFMHDMFLISTEIGLSTDWWLQWLKAPADKEEK